MCFLWIRWQLKLIRLKLFLDFFYELLSRPELIREDYAVSAYEVIGGPFVHSEESVEHIVLFPPRVDPVHAFFRDEFSKYSHFAARMHADDFKPPGM